MVKPALAGMPRLFEHAPGVVTQASGVAVFSYQQVARHQKGIVIPPRHSMEILGGKRGEAIRIATCGPVGRRLGQLDRRARDRPIRGEHVQRWDDVGKSLIGRAGAMVVASVARPASAGTIHRPDKSGMV